MEKINNDKIEIEAILPTGSILKRVDKDVINNIVVERFMTELFKKMGPFEKLPDENMLKLGHHKNITKIDKIINGAKEVTSLEVYLLSGRQDTSKYLEHSVIVPKVFENERTRAYKNDIITIIENKGFIGQSYIDNTNVTVNNIIDWCKSINDK